MNHASAQFIPPLSLNPAADTPLYQQISGWFQRAVLTGTLRPGQRVPSTRELASALNVSRISVLSAYELLIANGYFEPSVGVGTCVANTIPDGCPPRRGGSECRGHPERMTVRAAPRVSRRAASMCGPAQTWMEETPAGQAGTGAPEEFPAGIWSRIVTRHVRRICTDIMGRGDPMGHAPFRRALAHYLGASRAVRCDETQILVTAGSQQALQICALALLDPGDSAWVEEPGYPGARLAVRAAGGEPVPVPVDAEGLDVECGLRRDGGARLAYVTPSQQFPLGVPMSCARRLALLEWARRRGAWIIEDDYDGDWRAHGPSLASLQSMDTEGRVIYVGTLSTAMFPALRLGYVIVPADLTGTFTAVRSACDLFPSPLYQLAMTDFIQEGHLSRRIKRLRAAHAARRFALVAALRRTLPEALQWVEADAATRILGLLPPGVPDCAVARRIAVAGLRVKALSPCYLGPPARSGLILDCANLHPNDIHQAVLATAAAIRCQDELPAAAAATRSGSNEPLHESA